MKMFQWLAAVLGLTLSQITMAAPDIYGGVGLAHSKYDTKGEGSILSSPASAELAYSALNPKAMLGFKSDGPGFFEKLAFELQYMTIGGDSEVELTERVVGASPSSGDADTDGYSFGIAGVYYFSNKFFAKLGLHKWKMNVEGITANGTGISIEDKDNAVFYGLGYQTSLLDTDAIVRLEYEGLRIDPEGWSGSWDSGTIHNFGVSIVVGL